MMTKMPWWMFAQIALASLFFLATAADAQKESIPVTGPADPALVSFDDMMLKFMRDNQVPGAALAVTKGNKLVYARGFGHADPQLGLSVQPDMRFRIASISKPITAAAILRLIELGLLKMDGRIDPQVHEAANRVKRWPDRNLFAKGW